jgi:hypothetical protein
VEAIPNYSFRVHGDSMEDIQTAIKEKVQPLFFHYEITAMSIEDEPFASKKYRANVTVVNVGTYGK